MLSLSLSAKRRDDDAARESTSSQNCNCRGVSCLVAKRDELLGDDNVVDTTSCVVWIVGFTKAETAEAATVDKNTIKQDLIMG
ncbi:hypothetical protein ACHAWC_008037 [Mediolabrus comicus]